MSEKLIDLIREHLKKPISILLVSILMVVSYIGTVTSIKTWEVFTINKKSLFLIALPFISAILIYILFFFVKNKLPKAPKNTIAILFCIDAENQKLFENAKYKLVNNFNSTIDNIEDIKFYALCVESIKLSKYDLKNPTDASKVLDQTNCTMLVRVRYTADDVDNADNFELKINYGVQHPHFSKPISQKLSYDMYMLKESIGKQRFSKKDTIDVFNSTTQTLVYACQYIMGVVALLTNQKNVALSLFLQAKSFATDDILPAKNKPHIVKMINDRIFEVLCKISIDHMKCFQNTKKMEYLNSMCEQLEKANKIYPETYFYNINMAYAHIIMNRDFRSAIQCIKKCKIVNLNNDWRYSDAFLSAYHNADPEVIFSKYKAAFRKPYSSLSQIVEYIEIILEREPDKIALNLAAGLVYEEMGDIKLMKYHFTSFLKKANRIHPKTQKRIEEKLSSYLCNINCDHACTSCKYLDEHLN